MGFSTWQQYIATLPLEAQNHALALRQQIAQIATASDSELQSYIFLPDQTDHAEFEDAAQVFAEAFVQMQLREALAQYEIPLLFVGYHVATRFTGKRFAQGILLTDQAVYMQDDFSVLSEAPLAQSFALPRNSSDVPLFTQQLGTRFQRWKDWLGLADASAETFQPKVLELLQNAISAVLHYHQQHGSQQNLQAQPIDLAKFIASHGLGSMVLAANVPENAKKLGKISAKFKIPAGEAIHLALAEFPLFGGPYGMALTRSALYTKDLMEDPLRLPLAEVDERSLRYSDDGKEMRINGDTPVFFPIHIKSSVREQLLDLLKQEIKQLKS